MIHEDREIYLDLLAKKATAGVDDLEQAELDEWGDEAETELNSFEIAAAAVNVAGISVDEPMPSHLYARIYVDAAKYMAAATEAEIPTQPVISPILSSDDVFTHRKGGSWFGWLGWAAAAAAGVALALNLWVTRVQPPPQEARVAITPQQTPRVLTPAEAREAMMASAKSLVTATWAPGNLKDVKQITGDIVWSDELQAGYMRFRGLPMNDPSKETYQLWIFDKTQDKATPIDGGTFNISSDGDVVVPINAKLKAAGPEMFAVTIEKPGGVVVSKREKLAAIAKVGTQSS